LAGTPFPLGHNRDYAYGLTMFENDDIDFYRKNNSPRDGNKYKTPAGFSDYIIRGNYQSKDTTDVVLNVKVSRHGPS
jgi:penicillin amidase